MLKLPTTFRTERVLSFRKEMVSVVCFLDTTNSCGVFAAEMPSTGSDLLSMGVLNQNVLNSLLGHTNGLNVLNHLTGGGGEKKLPMTSEMGESDELSVELGRMHPSAFSQSPNHSIDISNFSSKMDPLTLHQVGFHDSINRSWVFCYLFKSAHRSSINDNLGSSYHQLLRMSRCRTSL